MGLVDRAILQAMGKIKKYGERCQWLSAPQATVQDPSKPWIKTPVANIPTPVSILFVVGNDDPFFQLVQGSDAASAGQKGIMASVEFTPTANDIVIRSDGSKLALKSASPLQPDGRVILWRLVFKA